MTKREREIVNRYNKATATELKEVYGKPSKLKQQALKKCKEMMEGMDGERFRIMGANNFSFSAAFKMKDSHNGKTLLVYITKESVHVIEME